MLTVEKKQYAGLIRAQLSTFELIMQYYNAMSKYGVKWAKPLYDKYNFFKNMNYDLLYYEEHKGIYESLTEGQANGG